MLFLRAASTPLSAGFGRYAAAVGGVLLAWALREALMPLWGLTAVRFTFFWPAVVFAAWFGRAGPALLALGLSTAFVAWFFIEPRHGVLAMDVSDVLAVVVFVGTGFCLILPIEAMHRANGRARADLEERRRSEDALRASERTLSAMLHALPTAVALQRFSDGVLVDVNEAFVRLSGYARSDLLGRTPEELRLQPDTEGRRELLEVLRRDGAVSGAEVRLLTRSGEARDAIVNMDLLELHGETHILSSLVDVGDKKRVREETERLNAELDARVRERTAELEAFTYSVAHDLRAPLRGMRGFAELILEDAGGRLAPEQRDYLQRISQAASRMDALIRDLLAYSRLGLAEISTETVALDELLREALQGMEREISARGAEVRVEQGLPSVRAHRTSLAQAVVNLVSNALKFVAPGVAPRVRIAARTRPGWVRLVVEDNGIGVAPEFREKIFRVFERLHGPEDYPGTGIGLAIVRRAVDKMGGRSGVEPRADGPGSRFWLELPAATESGEIR